MQDDSVIWEMERENGRIVLFRLKVMMITTMDKQDERSGGNRFCGFRQGSD